LEHHQVRIHINQHKIESPSPTTGADLYELAKVHDGLVLYQEVTGDAEDKLVRIDAAVVHLTQDEHFHTGEAPERHFTIIVNTDPFVLDHDLVTFDEVVKLAYPEPPTGPDPEFTVSFEHAKSAPHHSDLAKNGSVTVKKHGTNFDVGHTNRS